MPPDKGGRGVFVGNIPYGLTEEQVSHLLRSCGELKNFRLVYDKENGRPKGFGFAEFADSDAAATAVRNLDGHEIQNRKLKVDWSNDDGTKDSSSSSNNNTGHQQHQHPQYQYQPPNFAIPQAPTFSTNQQMNGMVPQLQVPDAAVPAPAGVSLPPNVTATDSISQTLAQFDPAQLLDLVSQMKNYVSSDPRQATVYLSQNQNLCYAMFQALLLLGLVDPTTLAQVVQAETQGAAQGQYQAPPPLPVPQQQQQQQYQQYQQAPQHYPPPQMPPQPSQMPGQYSGFQQPPSVPTPPTLPATHPPKPPGMSDEHWAQITALCLLPQAQIDLMGNPQEREAVNNIRSQYGVYFTGQASGR